MLQEKTEQTEVEKTSEVATVKTAKKKAVKTVSKIAVKAVSKVKAKTAKKVKAKTAKKVKAKTKQTAKAPKVEVDKRTVSKSLVLAKSESNLCRMTRYIGSAIAGNFINCESIIKLFASHKVKLDLGDLKTSSKFGLKLRNGFYSHYASSIKTGRIERERDKKKIVTSQFQHSDKVDFVPVGQRNKAGNVCVRFDNPLSGYRKHSKRAQTAPSKEQLKEAIQYFTK